MKSLLFILIFLTHFAFAGNLNLHSSAFGHLELIPYIYTCQGGDHIPSLSWTVHPKAKSYALIIDDPDAPNGDCVHWIVYNIPGNVSALSGSEHYPMGRNSYNNAFYQGPCPPQGKHRYFFKLYALDIYLQLHLPTKMELLQAMEHHILVQDTLIGIFSKNP